MALLVALAACGGSQLRDPEAADLAEHLPATLEAPKAKTGDPRTITVRIYADTATRIREGWKAEITDQLDYASQFLTPFVGAQIKVDAIKDWDYVGEAVPALRALSELDPGDGVQWVIGYIAPLERATSVFSELTVTEPLAKHIVIRGWAEDPERESLATTLPDMSEAARTEVLGAHRRHKQTVILLRSLAITLGGIPELDAESILHPQYAPKVHAFADRNRELVELALADRLGGGTNVTVAKALLESIEKTDWGGWMPADKEDLVTRLNTIVDATKSGRTAVGVPAAALQQFERVELLARQGKIADALAELDNLLAAFPANATMHQMRCQLHIMAPGVKDPATLAACAKVSELAPGDPGVHLLLADAFAKVDDVASTRAQLLLVAQKIPNLPVGGPDVWRAVISLYQRMGTLTWTEEALAAAGLEQDPLAVEVAQKRARYGVPKGMKIKPEEEALLVAAVRGALDQIYANKSAEAARTLDAAEKRWPGAAGLAAARCDLHLRADKIPEAKAACAKALKTDPNESWALYLSGVIALRDASGTKAGIAKLEAAIKVDPELGQAWRTLAKAYARAKNQAALEKLAADYQARFGSPLPTQ